ncbi:MAG TPA: autotransporter outer membrane beta-barrel domain-containing protein [Burkholderiales bacterium]|nr:autotransporter outer membrane beta-barrel domain-containing protein [Burkholderiales bacterium]
MRTCALLDFAREGLLLVIVPALHYPDFTIKDCVRHLGENVVVQKTLRRILGCVLLLYGNTTLAFTLVVPPGNTVTDSFTLETQVQPIAGTIRGQIFGHLRPGKFQKTTQLGGMILAANAHSSSSSDVTYLAAATDGTAGVGSAGSGDGDIESLWVSTTIDSLENTFSRIAFHGTTQNVIVGFDFTRSSRYVFGVSGGYEASNFTTDFNIGNEKTQGLNINPYFAWLLSDTWSLDLIGGYGKFNTEQSRTVLAISEIVSNEFSSKRGFVSTNLTNVSTFGNWKLTSSLGYLWSKRESEAYPDSIVGTVDESTQTSKQWNLLGEIAYGRSNSETFFGARYEDIVDYHKIEFSSGEQPANDPTSFLLTAGWRYFSKDLSANLSFNTRLGQEDIRGYGFSMLLRIDL